MIMEHPSLDITGTESAHLKGKKVVLCVSGSVAAYRTIDLARILMRHGAQVRCVMSEAATKLITPEYMTWATGNKTVAILDGEMEHVQLADFGRADIVVAYPATANTIGKMANGIDDTALSTVLTIALGSDTPIIICPAMHQAMYRNTAVERNIEFLRQQVRFLPPNMTEGKAKVAEPQEVLDAVIETITKPSKLKGKKILLVTGPTMERIDPVRAITNTSSGRTGVLLASEFILDGCSVTMVYGPGREKPPLGAKVIDVISVSEMMEATLREAQNDYDVIVMAAAASDFTPSEYRRAKIDSNQNSLEIRMDKTPKIINRLRDTAPNSMLVGFKAEVNISNDELVRTAREKLLEVNADLVVANDVGDGYQNDSDSNRVIVVDQDNQYISGRKRKEDIVKFIKEKIEEKYADTRQ